MMTIFGKHTGALLVGLLAGLVTAQPLSAQTNPSKHEARVFRTEVIPFDTRHDADNRNRAAAGYNLDFAPEMLVSNESGIWGYFGQRIEIPYEWTDGVVFLHLENVPSAGILTVNDMEVAHITDPRTPADYDITPYIRQGANRFLLRMESNIPTMSIDAPAVTKPKHFARSYLYYQNKRSIADFEMRLEPDSAGRDFGVLRLNIIARNAYNYEETVTVGYDIYSPQGKLLEFNIVDRTIAGRSTDTIRFAPYIYHTFENKWEPNAKKRPPLYKVMLFTRRNGVYKEYMPLRVGFGRAEWIDGRLMRLGKEISLEKVERFNASSDRIATAEQMLAMKAAGVEVISPDYPQPAWYYELCDEYGLYVIDRANISAPATGDDRRVGGTPSNNPDFVGYYLERVKAMYYRSRNFTCVVGYALGGEAGNGYCMYKAYEWLKSVEPLRPVLYDGAEGEWNSDR